MTWSQHLKSLKHSTRSGIIPTKIFAKSGKKWFAKNSLIWTSNRYGNRCIRVLCLLIASASKIKVFIIKCNDAYLVHLVACGYSQVPSVNFSKNYSLVVNNATFCALLLMVLYFIYSAKIVSIKTAFLYGYLEEEIYDLVQAARQYHKMAIKILEN